MENKELKDIFDKAARANGFLKAHGCWYIESDECLLVLELQKSNFGNFFKLNIKIFIQGMFGIYNKKSKDELRKYTGTVFRNQPISDNYVFEIDQITTREEKEKQIETFFESFLMQFAKMALTKQGLKKLAETGDIYLFPTVKEQLYSFT